MHADRQSRQLFRRGNPGAGQPLSPTDAQWRSRVAGWSLALFLAIFCLVIAIAG